MEYSPSTQCPTHNKPLLFICCLTKCGLPITVCSACKHEHLQHEDKLMPYETFVPGVFKQLKIHNSLDIETLRSNDALVCELNQFRKLFADREKSLLALLMRKLEEEKQDAIRKINSEKEREKAGVVKYFDKMSGKGLIQYRLLFSSQKGLQNLYRSYKQYCEISDISCHIK